MLFAILWAINLCVFSGLAIYGSTRYSEKHHQMVTGQLAANDPGVLPAGKAGRRCGCAHGRASAAMGQIALGTGLTVILGVVVAAVYLWIAARFPRQLIVATIVAKIGVWLTAAAFYAYLAHKSGGSYVPVCRRTNGTQRLTIIRSSLSLFTPPLFCHVSPSYWQSLACS